MTEPRPSAHVPVPPTRSIISVIILLVMVLSVTLQLITGLYMTSTGNKPIGLIHTHAGVGLIALVATIAEWIWLISTPSGRYRMRAFVSPTAGPIEWSEGAFLAVATVTIFLGATLASSMYLGIVLEADSRIILFKAHQGLAQLVAVVYVVHSALAMIRGRKRSAARRALKR